MSIEIERFCRFQFGTYHANRRHHLRIQGQGYPWGAFIVCVNVQHTAEHSFGSLCVRMTPYRLAFVVTGDSTVIWKVKNIFEKVLIICVRNFKVFRNTQDTFLTFISIQSVSLLLSLSNHRSPLFILLLSLHIN